MFYIVEFSHLSEHASHSFLVSVSSGDALGPAVSPFIHSARLECVASKLIDVIPISGCYGGPEAESEQDLVTSVAQHLIPRPTKFNQVLICSVDDIEVVEDRVSSWVLPYVNSFILVTNLNSEATHQFSSSLLFFHQSLELAKLVDVILHAFWLHSMKLHFKHGFFASQSTGM